MLFIVCIIIVIWFVFLALKPEKDKNANSNNDEQKQTYLTPEEIEKYEQEEKSQMMFEILRKYHESTFYLSTNRKRASFNFNSGLLELIKYPVG